MARYRILALDGGGVRGVITAVWLRRLEQELGAPIRKHFDLIAGTSTGSILACALAVGRPPAALIRLYQEKARLIFPRSPKPKGGPPRNPPKGTQRWLLVPGYDGRGLTSVLRAQFKDGQGGDLLFGQLHPSVKLMVLSYDTISRRPIIFNNHNAAHAGLPVYEIVKSSCSAPIYFPAHVTTIEGQEHALIDGGVVASNPALCGITEALSTQPKASLLVASFGSGQASMPIAAKDAQGWGAIGWLQKIVDVLMDGPMDLMDMMAPQLVGPSNYYRFQCALSPELESIDNATPDNLERLIKEATAYIQQLKVDQQIKRLAAALKTA
ncbi:MAG: patatin-like phospholipase family protein [Nevskiales bacterium]